MGSTMTRSRIYRRAAIFALGPAVAAGLLVGLPTAAVAAPAPEVAPLNLTPDQTVDRLDPIEPGALTIAPDLPILAAVGDAFTVSVDVARGQVSVRSLATGREVWGNAAGESFLAASRSRLRVFEDQGAFWPHVRRSATFPDQRIVSLEEADDSSVTMRGYLGGPQGRVSWRMTLRTAKDDAGTASLGIEVQTGRFKSRPLDSVLLASVLQEGEAVHGFGSQYRGYDLRGTLFPVMVREQGVGRGELPISTLVNAVETGGAGTLANTYAAWPTWLTSGDRSLGGRVVGPAATAFGTVDLTDRTSLRLEMRAPRMAVTLVEGSDPADALRKRDAGIAIPGVAAWTSEGAILGLQGGTAEVRAELQAVLDQGAKISAVWLQDWVGRRTTNFGSRLWWTWQLDDAWYPGWNDLVDDLEAEGIKVLTYVNPMLTDPSAKTPAPARNLYQEAVDNGYFVKTPEGEPYLQDQGQFTAALIDLTDPSAREWYTEIIATQVLAGKVAGFMADFGEGLPYDAVLAGGSGAQLHNEYPLLWAQTVRDACALAGKPDCVAWMRSGIAASAQYAPVFWGGDQMVSFAPEDGMPSALYGIHASAAAGWPLMHSDVGGYTSVALVNYVRGPELLPRWAQMEAFGAFMRTHEGNQPKDNLQVYTNAKQARLFAYATKIYAALADYRRSVIDEAVATGMPAVRHPILVHPEMTDPAMDRTFFLGEHLFVTPVMAVGARSVRVAFPPGTWVHALTGEEFVGSTTHTVAAPLNQATAFVLKGDPVGEEIRAALIDAGVAR